MDLQSAFASQRALDPTAPGEGETRRCNVGSFDTCVQTHEEKVVLRRAKRRREKDRKRILNEQLNEAAQRGGFHEAHRLARRLAGKGKGPRRRKLEALPVTCRRTEERVLTLQQPMLKGGCADTRIIFDDEVDTLKRLSSPTVVNAFVQGAGDWRCLRSPV